MKKSRIITLSILVLFILSAIIYVSYGYVTAKIEGNTESKKLTSISQILKVEYSGGTNTLTSAQENYFIPGSTLTKTFNITNKSNIDLNYAINLTNVTNNFTRPNDLIYELYLEDELVVTGQFPEGNRTIAYNQHLDKEQSASYTLKIIYKTSDENQIEDQGKIISASIDFEQQLKDIPNIKILGNSIQNGTPSTSNPVEILSVGDKSPNLFNKAYLSKTKNYTVNSGSGYFSAIIKLKPNTTYTLFTKRTENTDTPEKAFYAKIGLPTDNMGSNQSVAYYITSSSNFASNNKKTITTGDDGLLYFAVSGNGGQTYLDLLFKYFYFQLVEGTEEVEYEPYGYNVKLIQTKFGKNYVDLDNYTTAYSLSKSSEYWTVQTRYNVEGIKFITTGKFEVGDKVSFRAKVNMVYKDSPSVEDAVTLRLYNATKDVWFTCGSNGIETDASTILMNTPKLLKCDGIIFDESLYSKGDTLHLMIVKGFKWSNPQQYPFMNFNLYTDTVLFAKENTEIYNLYIDEPLRKVGDYQDYIDLQTGNVVRYVKVKDDSGTLTIDKSYEGLTTPIYEYSENIQNFATNINADELKTSTTVEGQIISE